MTEPARWNRRTVLAGMAAGSAFSAFAPLPALAQVKLDIPEAVPDQSEADEAAETSTFLTKPIPATGERIPVVGLGTWVTFNVGRDPQALERCTEIMRNFFDLGGTLIDSSPMYGSAQDTIGHGLSQLEGADIFSADKVWTSSGSRGPTQIDASRGKWGVPRFDLLQVHNLRSWEPHLETLFEMKAAGQVRYVGITTSDGRAHSEFLNVMRSHPLDFIQVTYNPVDRQVEEQILPLARDRGMAVIINRPYRHGDLIDHVQRHPLPSWAPDVGAKNWPEFLLKFIISHPAVTCAIPATSQVEHVRENMGAAHGILPDAAMRRRMAAHVVSL